MFVSVYIYMYENETEINKYIYVTIFALKLSFHQHWHIVQTMSDILEYLKNDSKIITVSLSIFHHESVQTYFNNISSTINYYVRDSSVSFDAY